MDEDIIKQLVKLIEQLKDGLLKQQTEKEQYLDAIVNLEKLQLNCVELEKFENPSELLIQVMNIAADEMEGLQLWKKVKVVSVAYQLILVAYAFNKNKITLTGDSKKCMGVYIQKMRDQIQSSKNSENRLFFYLDVIETGMSALENDDGTLRSFVFECTQSILKLTCAAFQGNYDDVIENSLSLVKQLKEKVDSKSKFSWFQQILILNISVGRIDKNITQTVLDYVTQFIQNNINSDWHLAYAGLDIVQKIFENLGTIQQHFKLIDISYILALLRTVQKMKTKNSDMWHIREKIAEICILNCNHVHIQIQQELSDLIKEMRPEETNNKVRQTLENELITDQVKQCFLNKWNEVQNNEINKFQIISEQLEQIQLQINQNDNQNDNNLTQIVSGFNEIQTYITNCQSNFKFTKITNYYMTKSRRQHQHSEKLKYLHKFMKTIINQNKFNYKFNKKLIMEIQTLLIILSKLISQYTNQQNVQTYWMNNNQSKLTSN
ncbi:Hypothetical_protein [Hexamita inflata]|uniref:Hypothetical_protein n=1 Tax=Hexamita inflata TaxID=28002 RepID=A0ABP1GIF0_9EUKA